MAEAQPASKRSMELLFYIYGTDYLDVYPLVPEFMDLVGSLLLILIKQTLKSSIFVRFLTLKR